MEAEGAPRAKRRDVFLAHIGMVLVQLGYSVYHIVTKVALDDGTNKIVFCLYRDIVALLFLAPVAYFSEKELRPPLTANFLVTLIFLGATGIFANQILFLLGLAYTNPAYAAAIQPSIPIFTFILSLLMRVEKLHIRRIDGQAKVVGILICVSGAILMAIFRGPPVFGHGTSATARAEPNSVSNWSLGVVCLIGNCISMGAYIAVQAKLLVKYPAPISTTAFANFFGCLFIAVIALFMANMSTEWSFKQAEVFAVLYAGIVSSCINYAVMSVSNKILGPSIVALYNPLQPIGSAILSLIFLGSSVYLGSIIGGVLVVLGLYLVTWASKHGRIMNHGSPVLSEPFISNQNSSAPRP